MGALEHSERAPQGALKRIWASETVEVFAAQLARLGILPGCPAYNDPMLALHRALGLNFIPQR